MSKSSRSILVVALVVGLLGVVAPAAVAAERFHVHVDATAAGHPELAFLRFFPSTLSVHQGDVVDFTWDGTGTPHTVTAVPAANGESWRLQNVLTPGAPFQDPIVDTSVGGDDGELVENPAVVFPTDPTCGSTAAPCPFDGSGVVNAGLRFPGQGDFSLEITAPAGSYSFVCILHRGMSIPLKVEPAATTELAPGAVETRAQYEIDQAVTVLGAAAIDQSQTVQHVNSGNEKDLDVALLSAGGFAGNVAANLFPADPIEVEVGDIVRFAGTGEIHTVTFPADSVDTVPFITTQCEVPGPDTPAGSPFDCASPSQFQIAFNATAIERTPGNGPLPLSEPAAFVNSGLFVEGTRVSFKAEQPGTYPFVCLVHGPSMSGVVIVN
jgi:plastocyanin